MVALEDTPPFALDAMVGVGVVEMSWAEDSKSYMVLEPVRAVVALVDAEDHVDHSNMAGVEEAKNSQGSHDTLGLVHMDLAFGILV